MSYSVKGEETTSEVYERTESAVKWCNKLVALWRKRRGETIVKDNLLTIENGGKNSLEYKDRKKLVAQINKMLPRVYQERTTSHLLATEKIQPVKSIRRPRKIPFRHYNAGLAYFRVAKTEIEVAVLSFKYGRDTIKCACTEDGKAYRYYELYGEDGISRKGYWLPIYDLQKSNVSSAILRLIKGRLERIVPRVP